jgi:phospholipid transport system substrate-binding protein
VRSVPGRLVAAGLIVAVVVGSAGAKRDGGATKTIEQAHARFKELLAKDGADADLAIAKEFRALFDVGELARAALGAHWGKMTEAQRARLVELLETIVHRTYVKLLRANQAWPVEYTGEKGEDGAVRVATVVKAKRKGRAADVYVDYVMVEGKAGWRVRDLVTDGVSVVKNYRSQFNRVIAKEGIDGLIARLAKKAAE